MRKRLTARGGDVLLEDAVVLPSGSKYGNTRTWSELCQREFASKAELRRGEALRMLEMAGEISHLEYQPQWVLSKYPRVTYTADFQYCVRDEDNRLKQIIEDVKGVLTEATRVRIAWLKDKYGRIVTLIDAKDT